MDGYTAQFRDIRVILRNGVVRPGRATADHASWRCVCRWQILSLKTPAQPPYPEMVCHACQRRYTFQPALDAVEEMESSLMVGPMPTKAGDIVVSHPEAATSMSSVWHVMADGQQECGQPGSASHAIGRSGALKLARLMARESGGDIFLLDTDSGRWTTLSD